MSNRVVPSTSFFVLYERDSESGDTRRYQTAHGHPVGVFGTEHVPNTPEWRAYNVLRVALEGWPGVREGYGIKEGPSMPIMEEPLRKVNLSWLMMLLAMGIGIVIMEAVARATGWGGVRVIFGLAWFAFSCLVLWGQDLPPWLDGR
ncbi:MAG: hypothetical protein Q8P50_01445 [Bacillota bacterium]|nr:hypothetical protein [Bacillota bacterium]